MRKHFFHLILRELRDSEAHEIPMVSIDQTGIPSLIHISYSLHGCHMPIAMIGRTFSSGSDILFFLVTI